jgi:PAS domain S-box-containing protein
MEFSLNTFSLALFVAAILSATVAFISYYRRKVYGAKTLFLLFSGLTVWSIAYGIEILNPGLEWHKFWTYVQFIPIPYTAALWLVFAIQYTLQHKTPGFKILSLLFIVPTLTVVMAWTNDLHYLMWSSMQMTTLNNIALLQVEFGAYFRFHIIYSYIAVFGGVFLFLRYAVIHGRTYQEQAVTMLATVIVFIIGNGLYIFDLLPFKGLDITPFSFTISSIILSYGLFRYHLLDLMPVANEIILQNIGDGVLVVDSEKRIVFINPAFEKMAGLLSDTSVGNRVDEVLFNWPDIFNKTEESQQLETKVAIGDTEHYLQVQISPIWHRDTLQGCIYVLHDITERASQEEKMRLFIESRGKVSEDFIFMALDKTNSAILDVNSSFTLATGYTLEEVMGKSILSLNLVSIETRALLNRLLLTSPGIYDMSITVRTKNRQEQEWNASITNLSLNETDFKIWVAQPTKYNVATRPIS